MKSLVVGWLVCNLFLALIGDFDANKHIPKEERKAYVGRFFDLKKVEEFAWALAVICRTMDVFVLVYVARNLN